MAINWKNHENPYGWLNDNNGNPLFGKKIVVKWTPCDDWYSCELNGLRCKIPSYLTVDEYESWVGTPSHKYTYFVGNGSFETEEEHMAWLHG